MTKLILGSQSPRRRDILNFFSIPFEQVSPDFDETQVLFQGRSRRFRLRSRQKKSALSSGTVSHPAHPDRRHHRFPRRKALHETRHPRRGFRNAERTGRQKTFVFTGVCTARGTKRYVEAQQTASLFTNSLLLRYIHTISTSIPLTKPAPMRSRAAAASLSKESKAAITTSWGCHSIPCGASSPRSGSNYGII